MRAVPLPPGSASGGFGARTRTRTRGGAGERRAVVGRTVVDRAPRRRQLPGDASRQSEAVERDLPRTGRAQLRAHPSRPLLPRRVGRRSRRSAPVQSLNNRRRSRRRTADHVSIALRNRERRWRHERLDPRTLGDESLMDLGRRERFRRPREPFGRIGGACRIGWGGSGVRHGRPKRFDRLTARLGDNTTRTCAENQQPGHRSESHAAIPRPHDTQTLECTTELRVLPR